MAWMREMDGLDERDGWLRWERWVAWMREMDVLDERDEWLG
jgi:hypothetical protein